MKKRVLMGLLLLTIIGTSAVFAQSQGKYLLEIYDLSKATYDTLYRGNSNWTREDFYFVARSASGTKLRSKDQNLSIDQLKQKLTAIDSTRGYGGWENEVNTTINYAQQKWGAFGTYWLENKFTVAFWVRRTE